MDHVSEVKIKNKNNNNSVLRTMTMIIILKLETVNEHSTCNYKTFSRKCDHPSFKITPLNER